MSHSTLLVYTGFHNVVINLLQIRLQPQNYSIIATHKAKSF